VPYTDPEFAPGADGRVPGTMATAMDIGPGTWSAPLFRDAPPDEILVEAEPPT
jgi:hypothetical protein